jgi:hypothetical protein
MAINAVLVEDWRDVLGEGHVGRLSALPLTGQGQWRHEREHRYGRDRQLPPHIVSSFLGFQGSLGFSRVLKF